ncbi:MAG: pesticidal protein Cry7Aa [Candidatus Kerfeldbacteria bacterium]
MVNVRKEGVLLKPTKHRFENQGVLNPSCVQDGNTVHMFYRAVRKGNYSSIGYARLDGPMNVVERATKPVLEPKTKDEVHGVEDPRVVFFEGTYYMTYTAYDGQNALIGLATSKDMKTWKRFGIISPNIKYHDAEKFFKSAKLKEAYYLFEAFMEHRSGPDVKIWDKDAFILPERINGKIAMIHRILPDIQIIYFDDFKQLKTKAFWEKYLAEMNKHIVMENKYWYETRNIGGGGPFIKTDKGWLTIFHSVKSRNIGRSYAASAALLDLKDPQKVIARTKDPLFIPEKKWEVKGDVDNVVFPTGTAVFGDRLYIYYGAADTRIAVASVRLQDLIDDLLTNWRHV